MRLRSSQASPQTPEDKHRGKVPSISYLRNFVRVVNREREASSRAVSRLPTGTPFPPPPPTRKWRGLLRYYLGEKGGSAGQSHLVPERNLDATPPLSPPPRPCGLNFATGAGVTPQGRFVRPAGTNQPAAMKRLEVGLSPRYSRFLFRLTVGDAVTWAQGRIAREEKYEWS